MSLRQKQPRKERFLFALQNALPLSLLAAITLFVFGPADLYFANPTDFWFTFGQLMGPMLLTGAILFAAMLSVLLLCGMLFSKKAFGFTVAFVFALVLGAYAQGTFFSTTLEIVGGEAITWQNHLPEMLVNTGVWLIILFACLLAYLIKNKSSLRVMRLICYILVGIQLMTGAITAIGNRHNLGSSDTDFYLSTDCLYDTGTGRNVVVFMLDTLDTAYMDELLAQSPETLSSFDGFTYYHNMGGSYRKTAGFMTFFLTGEKYLNQMPLNEFCQEYIPRSPLLNTLKANNFDIRMNADYSVLSGLTPELVDNLRQSGLAITSVKSFIKQWTWLLAYRYAPTAMRPFFFKDFNATFMALRMPKVDGNHPIAADSADAVMHSLQSAEMQLMDGNTFRFIPLFGAHEPYRVNADGEPVPEGSVSRMEAIRGSFKAVTTMIERMKSLGVYDQSAIVVMADHGDGTLCAPAFLMKYPDEHGALKVSQAPVSHEDLTATLLKAAGCINYREFGTPVDEWPEDTQRERFFYVYTFSRFKQFNMYFEPITEYAYTGDANDFDSYYPTGNIY